MKISLDLQTGDLVTHLGIPGVVNTGPNHWLGIVTGMFQDEAERWLANVTWFRMPLIQHRSPLGTYYNFRYSTCTEWVARIAT